MKKIMIVFFALCAIATLQAQQNRSSNSRNMDAARYYEEVIGNMTQQTKLLQDDNARLDSKVQELNRKVAEVERENQAIKREMEEIKKMLKNDASSRDASNAAMRKLTDQIEKMSQTPITPPAPPKAKSTTGAAEAGNYEEYVVSQGATLSAVAQAYGVSVKEIMRVNNLKSDRLRVGQKLLIPVQ